MSVLFTTSTPSFKWQLEVAVEAERSEHFVDVVVEELPFLQRLKSHRADIKEVLEVVNRLQRRVDHFIAEFRALSADGCLQPLSHVLLYEELEVSLAFQSLLSLAIALLAANVVIVFAEHVGDVAGESFTFAFGNIGFSWIELLIQERQRTRCHGCEGHVVKNNIQSMGSNLNKDNHNNNNNNCKLNDTVCDIIICDNNIYLIGI